MRIGRFSVPRTRLYPTLIDAVKTLHDKYGTQATTDLDSVAKTLGHASTRSGTFLLKLADLRAYGLIEGRGEVKVSDIGRKISEPSTREEEAQALESAVNNIPLWREVYQRFGTELPSEFTDELASIVGCSKEEAAEKAEMIIKSYLADTKPLRTLRRPITKNEPSAIKEAPIQRVIEIKLGEIHISLPANKRDIETARSLLDILEKRLRDSGKERQTDA